MTPSEIRNSKEAQEDMLAREDWPLIIEVMKPYVLTACDVGTNSVYDWEDLKAEAWLAVVEAVRTYDSDRGAAFTTHANWKIRRNVSRWMASNSGTLPMSHEAFRLAGKADELAESGLTPEEIEEKLGVGYIDDAIRARSAYVQIDAYADDHNEFGVSEGGVEDVPFDEVVLGFMYSEPSDYAIEEFCEEHGLDAATFERMKEVAHENRTRPGTDDGRSVANRQRGTEKSRNRRG